MLPVGLARGSSSTTSRRWTWRSRSKVQRAPWRLSSRSAKIFFVSRSRAKVIRGTTLLGLSGLTNDMRDLLAEESQHQDRRARLAIEIFCQRVKKYLGAYLARMNGADAVVFTGGIGENSAEIRRHICEGLGFLGIALDSGRNSAGAPLISSDASPTRVRVIPTDEEFMIATEVMRLGVLAS